MPDSNAADRPKLPPIGATFRGPGPAKYQLPTSCSYIGHDLTKPRNRAVSFGYRHTHKLTQDCSPGPIYQPKAGVDKNGPDGSLKYSMQGLTKPLSTFQNPGPGQYSPEKYHPPNEKKAPSFTIKTRTKYLSKNTTPSPSSYMLPPLMGPKVVGKPSAPAFSLSARSTIGGFNEDLQKTPGPGTYKITSTDRVKRKMPAYTIKGRNYMPCDNTQKPGPGAHSPEKVKINKTVAPRFSFGIRHSEFMRIPDVIYTN